MGVTDRFPDSVGKHRVKFVFFCCVVGFLLGLPLTTKVYLTAKETHIFNIHLIPETRIKFYPK